MARYVDLDSAAELLHTEQAAAAAALGIRPAEHWRKLLDAERTAVRRGVAALLDDLEVPYRDRRREGEGLP